MNYYELNMECIRENRHNLYKKLETVELASFKKLEDIQSVDTKDGKKALKIKYKSIEYRLNSIYRPVEEAEKWVEQYQFQNLNTIISMFGFGNGVFARTIMKKMGNSDLLIIYEPCIEIFSHVLNNYDITDILASSNIAIFIEELNDFEFHTSLQATINITNLKTQINCIYPQYDKIFVESCASFFNELRDSYSHARLNINTEIYFGQKYIENIFKNLRHLKNSNSLQELKEDIPIDVPAIIVAAGPSVGENLEELKRAKGKSIIFAVDRILDYLLDSGIEPDFVVTIDPKKPLKYFSKRTDVTIPLISYLESNCDILDQHKGRKIICTRNTFIENIYKQVEKPYSWVIPSGSVAIVAFSACIELGFKKVILVGQDLAYDGNNSHADGVEENRGEDFNVFLEGIDGNQVKSRYDWKEFVIRYEDLIKIYSDVEVIDAKKKGAKIEGSIVMPLKDAMNKYCNKDFNYNDIIKNKKVTFDSNDLDIIQKYIENNLDILERIKERAKAAIILCNKLLIENKYKEDSYIAQASMKELRKINNYIEKQTIYSIMDSYIMALSAEELSELYLCSEDVKESNKKTYEKSKIIYKQVIEVVEYIIPRIKEAIKHISNL